MDTLPTKPLVLLMQLPVPNNAATNVPLAAGYIKAYAHAEGLLQHVDIEILPRELVDVAGDALLVDVLVARRPALLGISLYTWNSERSLQVALGAKVRLPDLLVVVGGPEVQRDNAWVLRHPAVDVSVIGEGEQTFAELLRLLTGERRKAKGGAHSSFAFRLSSFASIPGLAWHHDGELHFSADRTPLSDLAVLPSPYLLGYLQAPADGMLMVEVSRWCPYACSFCLYGRNMGPRLGNRYFAIERLLAEIRWGYDNGVRRIHFIEANLNLVPVFWPLMRALADLNAAGELAIYAELRGEHIGDEVADALVAAGLKVAEVGLQTANPHALRAARRRTDLAKWAAGTRRLLERGVEIFLDVIVGLPADDAAGVAETLDFIRREGLGGYDVFTLQVLPGTAVRTEAADYALEYQDRPPYYVLSTDRLPHAELRELRRTLKVEAGYDPDEVEGCPEPRADALAKTKGEREKAKNPAAGCRAQAYEAIQKDAPITQLWLTNNVEAPQAVLDRCANFLAYHLDVVARWETVSASSFILHPSSFVDLYLLADEPPAPETLRRWRAALPFQPGYLDRVAVYNATIPDKGYVRVNPRLWLVLPWSCQANPNDYTGVANIIWEYVLSTGEEPPLHAWRQAGGAGVWVRGAPAALVEQWCQQSGLRLWYG